MIWYVLLLLSIIYVFTIIKSMLALIRIKNLLEIIVKYLNSANINTQFPATLHKKENYNECLHELLLNYPAISRYATIYSESLRYGDSDIMTYQKSISLYEKLLMKRNFLFDEFRQAFNPISAVKTLFCIPSLIIGWIGFHPRNSATKILNLLCWIATYFLGLYSEELKALTTVLFQKFF